MAKKRLFLRGFTLAELLFSAALLIITLVPLVLTYINARARIDITREISIANDDARDVLEKIKGVPFPNIVTLFPPNTAINQSVIGGYYLPNENIVVSYPSGTTVLPLMIQVSISWTSHNGKTHNQVYQTSRTQML
jgi:hypothetical protein